MNEKELDRKADIFVDNYLRNYSEMISCVSLRQLFKEMYIGGAKQKSLEKSNILNEKELERRASKYEENAESSDIDDYGRKIYCGLHIEEAYIAGAKENISIPEWHDLKKNPNDVPNETGDYVTNVGVLTYDFYGDGVYRWHTPFCEACDYSEIIDNEVIAWCEIPVFDGNS